jgi:HlyD family secretion protein
LRIRDFKSAHLLDSLERHAKLRWNLSGSVVLKPKYIAISALLALSISALFLFPGATSQSAPPSTAKSDPPRAVGCLGRVVPGDKVIALSGPYSMQGPPVVKELVVRRGDIVKKGDLIARLDGFTAASAQVRLSEAEVEVAARVLDQVKAGEKAAAISAQEALALRFEAELKNAEILARRDKELFSQKAISETEFDRSQLALRVAQKNFDQASKHLESFREVRDVDVRVAEARLKSAIEAVGRSRADLEQTTIHASLNGTILEILTRPGERVDREPIVEIGDLDHLNIEAEVYVTDIRFVRVGARALATGDGFAGEISGVVSEVGRQVDKSSVFDPDPASFSDKRVVRVWIKIQDAEKVRALVNHQVKVVIEP